MKLELFKIALKFTRIFGLILQEAKWHPKRNIHQDITKGNIYNDVLEKRGYFMHYTTELLGWT